MTRIALHFASALIAVLALSVLIGCGKTGAPIPPKERDPAPIADLRAIQRGGVVTLYFTVPARNLDGTPFRDLSRLEVFRREKVESEGADKASGSRSSAASARKRPRASRIISIGEDELVQGQNVLGRKVRLTDAGEGFAKPEDWFGHTFEYYVVSRGKRWRESAPSNVASATPLLGPRSPEGVAAEAVDSAVRITWQPQTLLTDGRPIEGRVFYNVYRIEQTGWELGRALNDEPLSQSLYVDQSATNDVEYRYTVTSIASDGELFAESATSATVSAIPKDLTPPPAPFNLEAASGQGIVNLLWAADEAPDQLGYNVYRKKSGDEAFMLLTLEPIKKTIYSDEAVFPGVEYTYYVTAVDASSSRNESDPSNQVVARPR